MLAPITPPVCATALMMSSLLFRSRLASARALACVSRTGCEATSRAPSVVRSPTWERSRAMPTAFIIFMASRPSSVSPGLLRLETAIAKGVPEVVGELHDPNAEPPKEIQPIEFICDRPGVLHAHDDADPRLRPGVLEVGRTFHQ